MTKDCYSTVLSYQESSIWLNPPILSALSTQVTLRLLRLVMLLRVCHIHGSPGLGRHKRQHVLGAKVTKKPQVQVLEGMKLALEVSRIHWMPVRMPQLPVRHSSHVSLGGGHWRCHSPRAAASHWDRAWKTQS